MLFGSALQAYLNFPHDLEVFIPRNRLVYLAFAFSAGVVKTDDELVMRTKLIGDFENCTLGVRAIAADRNGLIVQGRRCWSG